MIGLPGGCPLGPRPIDQHIKGFKALGAEIDESSTTSMKIEAKELKGAHIFLDMVSVGATINIMLAAVYATGQTVIENAAKEPEVVDVANLTSMGANIKEQVHQQLKSMVSKNYMVLSIKLYLIELKQAHICVSLQHVEKMLY